mgnify:CR=1 FL=1
MTALDPIDFYHSPYESPEDAGFDGSSFGVSIETRKFFLRAPYRGGEKALTTMDIFIYEHGLASVQLAPSCSFDSYKAGTLTVPVGADPQPILKVLSDYLNNDHYMDKFGEFEGTFAECDDWAQARGTTATFHF